MIVRARIVVYACLIVLIAVSFMHATETEPSSASVTGLPLEGVAAEEFLRTAEILDCSEMVKFVQDSSGRTRGGCLAKLSDGEKTLRAVFKKHDFFVNRTVQVSGKRVLGWKESYRHEIAAYELDKLLGLGLVPPCVERDFRGDEGSLCMWVEGAMSEWERTTEVKSHPPDPQDWNRKVQAIELFMLLINDLGNPWCILIDGNWRLYKVHSARAFHEDTRVVSKKTFQPSDRVLAALRELDERQVRAVLEPWLSNAQIKGLITRRDLILELAAGMNGERGGS